ncbi:MAG: deacylase [SAR324 cluster bacterium]|uniref:Deacylase n=1 Tax=SAR324 cluster bacterium TaxID=2024889 RepID=A0A2A4T2H8_9DELT|nr:MAG: deacylase [SAR324 cluster bacterium]
MLSTKLKNCLDNNHVWYNTIQHSIAYTAQETAQRTHVPGKEFAKTVMVKKDGQMLMVVLPATRKLDLEQLRAGLGAKQVELAQEDEFRGIFPECEIGAMPPFGNLYGVDVVVAKALTTDDEIAFNAGTHSDIVKLTYKDYATIVQPKVVECSADID